MKSTYKIYLIFASLFLCVIVLAFSAFNTEDNSVVTKQENNVSKHKNAAYELIKNVPNPSSFKNYRLFTENNSYNKAEVNNFASRSKILTLDRTSITTLNRNKPEQLAISLPDPQNGNTFEILLSKIDIYSDNYKVREIGKNGIKNLIPNKGLHYQGILKDDENSMVTISVFENSVMGIISTDNGNFVLGPVKDENKMNTDSYIIYNDLDMVSKPGFDCGSGNGYDKYYRPPVKNLNVPTGDQTTSPVDIYFVCDYQMYLDNGSNSGNTAAFVNGAFAHVRTIYLNEGLTVNIQAIDVYTSSDPYANLTTSTAILELFGDNTQNALQGGDLAQLLSTGHGQQLGGIAWINVLCQSYEPSSHSGRFAFSNIEGDYSPYPTYSWTVMVIAHETGHNFGSQHTHACVWPTTSGQIDSCYTSEGGCVSGTTPNNNGTVMSYCHLNGAINLLRGFGQLPHDTITLRYNEALCLDNPLNSSEFPLDFNLLQNYPNPFNPSTNIKFALPQDGLVTLRIYDVSGREVAKLINSQYYPIGIFSYTLDASTLNLASGVYLYKLDVSRENNSVYSEIKKMVLVK